MQSKRTSRRLGFENLEARALLAGNVMVSVENNVLLVTGDNAANRIDIRQLPASGAATPWPGARYEIVGYVPTKGPPTLVNGQRSVIVEGVKDGAKINMQGGNDSIWISRPRSGDSLAAIPGKVDIDMGEGDDRATLYLINYQQVNVNLGKGADSTYIPGKFFALNVVGDPTWQAGDPPGGDHIRLAFSAAGPVSIDAGYGDNTIDGSLKTTTKYGTVDIKTGNGADKVSINTPTSVLAALMRIDTGHGSDSISLGEIKSRSNIGINTGGGDDFLFFRDIEVSGYLSLWMGDGDDTLVSRNTNHAESVVFRGGDGKDTLDLGGNNTFTSQDISGFEA